MDAGSRGVVLLVMIFLVGPEVLASSASLLQFLGLCIGRWMIWTWVILGFPIWRFLSFSSNGLVIGCSVKNVIRPHVRAVSEGIEIIYGCQFISNLVRALAKLPGECSHGLTSRPPESCHQQCLTGFGCILKGQLRSFLMAS